MDPQMQALGLQLVDTAARNSAAAVAYRIRAVKAKKKSEETIADLEEIINGLLSDKNELVLIAQAYEEELVAQRLSKADVDYMTSHLIPILKQLIERGAAGDESASKEMVELLTPLLSVETVTILQLIGFNFKKAIGEPLTDPIAKLIGSKAQATADRAQELQILAMSRDLAYLEVAKDPEAADRLRAILGQ